jgi:hypothetical protein
MRSGVHGGPRIEVHPDGAQHGYRVLWWQSKWHTPESPDECATGYMSYAEAEDEMEEYHNDRADVVREQAAQEAYEAECGHGEG